MIRTRVECGKRESQVRRTLREGTLEVPSEGVKEGKLVMRESLREESKRRMSKWSVTVE